MTSEEEEDFLDTYHRTKAACGEDATHEAVALTLHHGPTKLSPYLVYVSRKLRDAGYNDGRGGVGHRTTWDREVNDDGLTEPESVQWASIANGDPARQAEAREKLRALPSWLIDLHIETGLTARKPCWAHGPEHWFLYNAGNQRVVQCRRCVSARDKARRPGRKA